MAIMRIQEVIWTFFIEFVAAGRSLMCSTKVSKGLLLDLKSLAEQFKMDVASLLLHKRFLKQQMEKRKEMLGLSEKDSKSDEKKVYCNYFESQ